jgi:hypothetical protein
MSQPAELTVTLAFTQRVYRQLSGDGWAAGLSYQRNLRSRHLSAMAAPGWLIRQTVGRQPGTFINPDGSRVAGTHQVTA